MAKTGWGVESVEALISFEAFYELLARKRFPAASFIRIPEELDYIQEPDIFHEIFGHCPLLTDQAFADFSQAFGQLGLRCPKKLRNRLQRVILVYSRVWLNKYHTRCACVWRWDFIFQRRNHLLC